MGDSGTTNTLPPGYYSRSVTPMGTISPRRRQDGTIGYTAVDYVDETVPMLARMAARRRTGYRALGYTIE